MEPSEVPLGFDFHQYLAMILQNRGVPVGQESCLVQSGNNDGGPRSPPLRGLRKNTAATPARKAGFRGAREETGPLGVLS
jgi:hypothetical protein